MSDSDRSLLSALEEYSSGTTCAFHMPGHKRNTGIAPYLEKLGARYDITEIPEFDILHDPSGILAGSMARLSRLWGSKSARFLVNGSTCGILAGIRAVVNYGDRIIIARNCHKSVYNAVELFGLDPVFLSPPTDPAFGINASIEPEDVGTALDRAPDAKLVVITSPTYEGVISDIARICLTAHKRGVPVLVDEAHGAHLGFSSFFPGGAVAAGADIVIQSLHKTLPSLTQTAAAHLNGNMIDYGKFYASLSIFETSSPSYLLMSSIDGCARFIEENGNEMFYAWEQRLKLFSEKTGSLKKLRIFAPVTAGDPDHSYIYGFDRSKIVISVHGTELTGSRLAGILRERYNTETEMSASDYIVAMTGPGDTEKDMIEFADALSDIDSSCAISPVSAAPVGNRVIPGREYKPCAASSLNSEIVSLDKAAGRISAAYIWAYPPGIPLIIPGEIFSVELLNYIGSQLSEDVVLSSSRACPPGCAAVISASG